MIKEESLFVIAEDEKLEQEVLTVEEEPHQSEEEEEEPKQEGWLNTKEVLHFNQFLDEQLNRIPGLQHAQGNQSLMERSLSQWKKLNSYCSDAMRSDFDGILNVNDIDKKRQYIEHNIDTLQDAIDGLNVMKQQRRNQKRRRRAEEDVDEIVKEAGTPVFQGFQINITPLQRAMASILINGVVSGGRNLNEMWNKLKDKYDLKPREEIELMQILADMGYPVFKDRLKFNEENENPSDSKSIGEWQSQYYA